MTTPVTLPNGPPVRSDLERAYERIKELEDRERENARHFQTVLDQLAEQKILHDANEERIRELEDEIERMKAHRDAAWDTLNNLDTLARDISKRVEKMTSALDR